jgi:hypothetical protein
MDAAGAAHAGRYRHWHVSVLTRRAAGMNTYSTTKTSVSYGTIQTDYGSQQVATGVNTSTSVHNTLPSHVSSPEAWPDNVSADTGLGWSQDEGLVERRGGSA